MLFTPEWRKKSKGDRRYRQQGDLNEKSRDGRGF